MGYRTEYEPYLQSLANKIGAKRDWLYNVIMLESSWNADAYNRSGAVGLIQFMPQTLKDYGLLSPSLAAKVPTQFNSIVPEDVKQEVRKEFLAKYPNVISQLQGPVTKYFGRYRTYPTEQSLYMTVFYPAYRNASLDTVLSPQIQIQNPGVKTVGNYVAMVQSKSNRKEFIEKTKNPLSVVAIAALGLTAYYFYQSG